MSARVVWSARAPSVSPAAGLSLFFNPVRDAKCCGISNNDLSNSLQLAIGKRNRRVQVKYRWRVYCHPQTRDNKAEWYLQIHTTEWIPDSSLYPWFLHNTKLDFHQILMCIACFSGSYCVDVSIFSCLLGPNVTFEHILSLYKQRWCTRVNVSIVFREYIKMGVDWTLWLMCHMAHQVRMSWTHSLVSHGT